MKLSKKCYQIIQSWKGNENFLLNIGLYLICLGAIINPTIIHTLFLSIIIFDRYMSIINNIDKNKLQLIGVTSLLIACKYEEIFSPEMRDFICILDREYEKEDLMEEENNINQEKITFI